MRIGLAFTVANVRSKSSFVNVSVYLHETIIV